MLNYKKLLQNNTIWKVCQGSAIAIVVVGSIDIIVQIVSYGQQYQAYMQMSAGYTRTYSSSIIASASNSILQIAVTCLFYATVLFVASTILKGHFTAEEEKIVLTPGADDTQDDDERLEVEITDIPHPRAQ